MKILITTFVILTSCVLYFVPSPVQAQGGEQVSFQLFYDQLGAQGSWFQTDNYGYCWQPQVSDPNWRPYSRGHWVETEYGWAWVSDERFGWATYHYGRWANIEDVGWVWVPGYRWAPAWVSWRQGGGYSGWAPLPPECDEGYSGGGFNVAVGFRVGDDVDVAFNIGAGNYNFIPSNRLGEREYGSYYLNNRDNYRTIGRTRNITNIYVNNTTVNNYSGVNVGGPSLQEVNAGARNRVRHVNLVASNQSGSTVEKGDSLAVYAPQVNPNTRRTAKPARVAQTFTQPTINRGDDITRQQAVTRSVKPAAASAKVIKEAQTAQAEAPSDAKIARGHASAKTHPTQPVADIQPAAPAMQSAPPRIIVDSTAAPAPVVRKKDRKTNPVNAPSGREVQANTVPTDHNTDKPLQSSDRNQAVRHVESTTAPPESPKKHESSNVRTPQAAQPTSQDGGFVPRTQAQPTEAKHPDRVAVPRTQPQAEGHPQKNPAAQVQKKSPPQDAAQDKDEKKKKNEKSDSNQ